MRHSRVAVVGRRASCDGIHVRATLASRGSAEPATSAASTSAFASASSERSSSVSGCSSNSPSQRASISRGPFRRLARISMSSRAGGDGRPRRLAPACSSRWKSACPVRSRSEEPAPRSSETAPLVNLRWWPAAARRASRCSRSSATAAPIHALSGCPGQQSQSEAASCRNSCGSFRCPRTMAWKCSLHFPRSWTKAPRSTRRRSRSASVSGSPTAASEARARASRSAVAAASTCAVCPWSVSSLRGRASSLVDFARRRAKVIR